MALPLSETFEYEAEFTEGAISDSDIVLRGVDRRGCKDVLLVGHQPMIRFWDGRLILAAADSDRRNSRLKMISFPFGDAINHVAQVGDQFYITRIVTGDIGLSLLRKGRLILAIGAIGCVPLGDYTIPTDIYSKLREQDTVENGGYYIYVERRGKSGEPGTAECVSVCLADNPRAKIVAMRSAILLASGELRVVDWNGKWLSI